MAWVTSTTQPKGATATAPSNLRPAQGGYIMEIDPKPACFAAFEKSAAESWLGKAEQDDDDDDDFDDEDEDLDDEDDEDDGEGYEFEAEDDEDYDSEEDEDDS